MSSALPHSAYPVFESLLATLKEVISHALDAYRDQSRPKALKGFFVPEGHVFLQAFLQQQQPNGEEFITILLALAPHLQPSFLDDIVKEHLPDGGQLPAFGGLRGQHHRGILPTGETAQFILAGHDMTKRFEVQNLFSSTHWFATENILHLEEVPSGEPKMSGRLILAKEWLEQLISGQIMPPRFGSNFPAEQLNTALSWQDLVLPEQTKEQVEDILIWLKHQQYIKKHSQVAKHIKPGYRALFHGPSGTGKTLTVSLLGQLTGRLVFRVDLSMIISKYIGETEKNLAQLFDRAANKDWILFFDEADALFGKRTEVNSAHDRNANQEVSFLLQKVESFPGLVVLASNFFKNIDEAFIRRFQSIVAFYPPKKADRLRLWKNILRGIPLAEDTDLTAIAETYELNGAQMVNIAQYCLLQMAEVKETTLLPHRLKKAISRELSKSGKIR